MSKLAVKSRAPILQKSNRNPYNEAYRMNKEEKMENLMGMMLFLQIVISIQIMLVGKKLLQRLDGLEKKLTDGWKAETEQTEAEEKQFENPQAIEPLF